VRALTLFQRVLELKPFHFGALEGSALCAAHLKQWHVAHEMTSRLLRLYPKSSTASRIADRIDDELCRLL
jgi:hypothetical protein